MSFLGLICIPFTYYAILINLYGSANAPEGYRFVKLSDFWRTLVGGAITIVIKKICFFILPHIYRPIAKGETEEHKDRYCKKAADHSFRFVYFTFATIWGWSLMKEFPYLPPSIGGPDNGTFFNLKMDTIYLEYNPELLSYSCWTFGYHFGNLIETVFLEERREDFAEMVLHHVAAFFLYFGFIYGNLVPLGSIVAYFHDIADVPLQFGKVWSATRLEPLTIVGVLFLIPAWFWTRLVLLP